MIANLTDIKLLNKTSLEGDFIKINNLLNLIEFKFITLINAYKNAMKRVFRLKPNLEFRKKMELDIIIDKLNNEKNNLYDRLNLNHLNESLIKQGENVSKCCDIIYKYIKLDKYENIQLFLLILMKINNNEMILNFIKEYHDNIDFNYQDENGKNILHIASKNGNEEIIKFLLTYENINIHLQSYFEKNKNKKHRNVLHYAVKYKHINIIKLLLQYDKLLMHTEDFYGKIPLYYVAPGPFGNKEIFELLLKYGSNINAKYLNQTMLYNNVNFLYEEGVSYLLSLNASPYIPSLSLKNTMVHKNNYETPLDLIMNKTCNNLKEREIKFNIVELLKNKMNKL